MDGRKHSHVHRRSRLLSQSIMMGVCVCTDTWSQWTRTASTHVRTDVQARAHLSEWFYFHMTVEVRPTIIWKLAKAHVIVGQSSFSRPFLDHDT